ncbi:MAG: hypothetical protein IJ877_04190 [Candidatus Gastranaerophilales bacterium]|nr:hypothetical protein [Candidatus Gastranaerophilales bacterium]
MQLKNKKILFAILGVGIALVLIFMLSVNMLIKSDFAKNHILENLGLKYEAVNLKSNFDIKMNLNISADKIDIYSTDKKQHYLTLDKPSIAIKPLSLIFKKISVKKFNSDYVLINASRNEKGEIDILKYLNSQLISQNKFSLKRLNSDINKVEFVFNDNYIVKSKIKLSLFNSDIKISQKKNSFYIKEQGLIETAIENKPVETSNFNLKVQSNYPIDNFDFDVNLEKVNLHLFTYFANKYISNDIVSLDGVINLNIKTNETHQLKLSLKAPSLTLKENRVIAPYKEILLNTDFTCDKNKITVNNLDIFSNELFVNLKGDILKPFSKKPDIDIDAEIKNTQINNFTYFIPDNAIFYRPQGIPTLKKSNFFGLLNGKISLKYSPLDITGSMKIENIYIPGYPKSSHQNGANLIFMKDKMRVFARAYTPENEYVTIDGVSNLDDSLYGKYNVKSTNKIDLNFAQLYLVPIQQIIGFNIGPVPIMDITGYGNIDIKTQGTVKDAQIFGQFNAYSASTKIHGLDATLKNGNCKLIFDNRNLIFKEIKGNLDGAKFLLTGMGNTKGEVDLNVKITDAYLNRILKTFNNSVLTRQYSIILKNISAVSGLLNTEINLSGTINDYEKEEFLNNLDLEGNFELKNNKIFLNNGLNAQKIKGNVEFSSKKSQNGIVDFYINNSPFNMTFDVKESLEKIAKGEDFDINLVLNSKKCAFSDILKEVQNYKSLHEKIYNFIKDFNDTDFYSKINLALSTKISLNNITNFENIKTKGYIVGLNSAFNKNINFERGLVKFENNNITFDNFKMNFHKGIISAKGSINNDLKISLNNIDLEKFNKLLPKTKLQNAIIKSGEILLHENYIKLNSINIDYNKMPVLINLSSRFNSKNQDFEADFSTILNETTTDNVINPYLSYPIKVKGEIPLKGKFIGSIQNYLIDFTTTIPKDSDISFSGANIGDTSQDRELTGKINVNHNVLNLNNLRLIKYIKNQNNKLNPITAISLNGKIIQKDENIYYNNFKIDTKIPINVRILNLIFKKSILKKGNFECNLNLNGNVQTPKLLGKINLQDLDIPLYDTQINNIKVNITPSFIDANIKAKNKQSDLEADIRAQNDLKTPYIINKITINSNKLNIQDILYSIPSPISKTDITKKQDFSIKPQDIIVKDGNFNFTDVNFEKINAQNLKGAFSYKDNLFDLKNIVFNIARGQINAKGNYNLTTTKLNLALDMHDCDANILAKNFLNLKEQIFGKMTGKVQLSTKNLNSPEGIKNIQADVDFSIDNGKMPKLGSLEYLLRAGNILRNGVLGLSLNNLIQVLTPYKTGEFERISGSLKINSGDVQNIEILSKGKNLSMYLIGQYNILDTFADIEIYGRLSQNVSSALGALGNASVKQFISSFTRKKDTQKSAQIQKYLDKIPLVEGSNQSEFFSAKVFGDINKDNYIKKFNWE